MTSFGPKELTADSERRQWRVIIALNTVSTLAQIGQFGIAFALFPLALHARGAPAWEIGAVSSALWAGNLLGLIYAPRVISRIGYNRTVYAGLLISGIALFIAPHLPLYCWWSLAILTGLGMGLRWIANETWLFGTVPSESQGRIVGLHETLLGIAVVAGPALIALIGVTQWQVFAVAALFCGAASIAVWSAGASRISIAFTSSSALGPLLSGMLASAFGGGSVMVFTCVGASILGALAMRLRAPK